MRLMAHLELLDEAVEERVLERLRQVGRVALEHLRESFPEVRTVAGSHND